MSKFKIGQEITITEPFEIESALSNKTLNVKTGDKGFIDSKGLLHYTTGEARGKIHKVDDVEVGGYDYENIAKLIFKRLNSQFSLTDVFEDIDIPDSDFIEEIEDILSDIF